MGPRDCAERMLLERKAGKVAAVFGPEKSGLAQRRSGSVPHAADDTDEPGLQLAEPGNGGAGADL